MIHTPITISSISGVHHIFAETRGNGQIQHQLMRPPTPGRPSLPFAHPLLAISTLSLTSSFPRRGRLPYKIPEMMS
jgi:hypothetical protein